MESLAQFLARKGLHQDSSPEEVVKAKNEYRDQYMRQKQKEFRETHIRKEIYLTKREFGYLKGAAEKHQMKLSRFIKKIAFAYLKQLFIVPDDTHVRNLELELRRIGNNINQVTKHVNQKSEVKEEHVQVLLVLLKKIDNKVSNALRNPSKVQGGDQ